MSHKLKAIAGIAFASYLSGCSSLQIHADAPAQAADTSVLTPPTILYLSTLSEKRSAPRLGEMVAPIIDGRSYIVSPPVEGLSQSEFEHLAKWYLTVGKAANAAYKNHIGRPQPQKLMQGHLPADIISTFDADKEYSEEEISKVIFKVTNDMLQQLDPHSAFFPPISSKNFIDSYQGQFTGLGVYFDAVEKGIIIKNVMTGSPAQKAGLEAGDIISAGNGISFVGSTREAFSDYINAHQDMRLSVIRDGAVLAQDISVSKGVVKTQSVSARILNDEIAHIHISSFTQDTQQEFFSQMEAIKAQFSDKITGLIIDLRGNGGGSVQAMADIADYLTAETDLLTMPTAYPAGMRMMGMIGETDNQITDLPISVIIDHQSASSSELLAGILQDYKRATILGNSHSYGKATTQQLFSFTLPDGTAASAKITNGVALLPKTGSYQGTGIYPDILTPMSQRYRDHMAKNEGHNFEADKENALSISAADGVYRQSYYKCEITSARVLLDVFNMQSQSKISDFDASNDSASLCAIDHLTGKQAYSQTRALAVEQKPAPNLAPVPLS